MKHYMDEQEIMDDERVSILMEELMTSAASQKATKELVRRVVQIANTHVWAIMIIGIQETEQESES